MEVRWRSFNNSWYVCSHCAPHAGLPQELRVNVWRDFLVTARPVRDSTGLPLIAGDVDIWHPHFTGSRSRSCDVSVVPLGLMISSRLALCSPRDRATHTDGAGLDCIFLSRTLAVDVAVHDGVGCCLAPACCPITGSDHF